MRTTPRSSGCSTNGSSTVRWTLLAESSRPEPVSDLEVACRVALSSTADLGLGCALVGGFAVSVRVEPRFTRDIDIAVAAEDDLVAEALIRDLVARGHTPVATVEQQSVERLATARIRLADGQILDLLFASSGIEPELVAAAEQTEILPGLSIPVATVGHLIALKVLARDDVARPQDLVDLRMLLGVAGPEDIEAARTALELIDGRGYGRGRDLTAELGRLRPDPQG